MCGLTVTEPSPHRQSADSRVGHGAVMCVPTLILFGVSQLDSMKLSALKTATFGEETKVTSKKRKMKGGPNPLSCKKKKKSLAGNKEPITSENSDKPRRKRKRIKLAKHVKEYLIHNSC
ncbi:hypothetical protein J6590_049467 [Homalodisca vitripennis]|nr:hypothetical protein J6590_049467 [Homalodisca vitripennis]